MLELWQLDLSYFESVKKVAQRAADLPRLDIVLHDAVIWSMMWAVSEGYKSSIKRKLHQHDVARRPTTSCP